MPATITRALAGFLACLWCCSALAGQFVGLPMGIRGETQFRFSFVQEVFTGPNGEPGGHYGFWFTKITRFGVTGWAEESLYCTNGVNCDPRRFLDDALEVRILQAADRASVIDAIVAPIPVVPCADQIANNGPHRYVCSRLRAAVDQARADLKLGPPPPTSAPPATVWRVAPSQSGSRVVYAITNGRLGGPIVGQTVPVGTPCDPAAFKVTSYGITYAAVTGGAAVCVEGQQ